MAEIHSGDQSTPKIRFRDSLVICDPKDCSYRRMGMTQTDNLLSGAKPLGFTNRCKQLRPGVSLSAFHLTVGNGWGRKPLVPLYLGAAMGFSV